MSEHKDTITLDMFKAIDTFENNSEFKEQQISYWQNAWLRLKKNKSALAGLMMIVVILLFAIFGPYMSPYSYYEQDLTKANLPPKIPLLEKLPFLYVDGVDLRGVNQYEKKVVAEKHWFGTDSLGRDLWTRTWQGTRISLMIAFLAAAIDLVIGVTYGSISGYYGGRIDHYMQRLIEILVGIPNLIVVILFILILQPGMLSIILAMVVTGWVGMARIVRGQILKLKEQEFVLAAKTIGASDRRIIFNHLIPNIMGPIIITTMFTIPSSIFIEAFLSFIGLGLRPPIASLGTLVNDGFNMMRIYPHMVVIPSIIISLIMISFNLLGDGLRDAFDPKMRK